MKRTTMMNDVGIRRFAIVIAISAYVQNADQIDAGQLEFERVQISNEYFAEGAGYGDFNKDGVTDVVCGPYWWAGPEYQERHQFYDGHAFPNDSGYSDNFFSYGHDINGDGWSDVLRLGFPGTPAYWYENPQGKAGDWTRHEAIAAVDNESPGFTDINGDKVPDIICSMAGRLGYATIDPKNPTEPWPFHSISDAGPWQRFTHGLGVGDVNGDGRLDMLTSTGWYEQPESLENDPLWEPHPYAFCPGGSQMFAYDFDGDGDNDVVTSLEAHKWGLNWFENVQGDDGSIDFRPHVIMGEKPDQNAEGIAFSQMHALDLVDMDGDGLKDIVTGKCYWAHNGHDPGARDPAVLYVFRTNQDSAEVKFPAVQVDDDSGVGRQISIADVNQNGRPDIIVANKKGVFVFRQ